MPLSTTIVAETLQMWYIMPLSPFWQTKRKFCKAACIIWSIINGQKIFFMSCPLTLRPLGRKIWKIQRKFIKVGLRSRRNAARLSILIDFFWIFRKFRDRDWIALVEQTFCYIAQRSHDSRFSTIWHCGNLSVLLCHFETCKLQVLPGRKITWHVEFLC